MGTVLIFKTWLVWGALALSVMLFVIAGTWEHARDAWTRARPLSRLAFLVGVVGITLYGGSKGRTGHISYPTTDPEVHYLVNTGSYVTNDAVYVSFTRASGVPATASLIIDYRDIAYTNGEPWICYTNTTIRDFAPPQLVAFAAATNYNWLVYTDWTPGSAVATNGVWHAYWGLDRKARVKFIPARTCIRTDGEVISTPKSKEDANAD